MDRHVGPFQFRPGKQPRVVARSPRGFHVGKKLYVGNLGYNVRSSDLEQLFSQFGEVQSAQVVTDRETGRGKGFGFVEMGSESDAKAAISGLNESEHEGRRLNVSEAKPREARTTNISRGGAGSSPGSYGGSRPY